MNDNKDKYVVVRDGQRVSENLDQAQADAEAARQRQLQESQGKQPNVEVKQSLVE